MKILVGFDGSNLSKRAADQALKIAKTYQADVELVESRPPDEPRVEEFDQAQRELDYVADLFKKEGLECRTHILVRGLTPGEDLVQFAYDKQMDLIVIGVRKRSRVDKMIFGSTTQYVVLNANCPVLTVK